jgi:DNA-binding transcriptional regulator YiaG
MTYTSYKVQRRFAKVAQCPADRMESARRFRALLSELGLSYPDAAQLLHVSLRTLHNWSAGTHAVPYAVTKLLRLLRYMELPGKAWQGWHFTRGCLVTPEGRTIEGHESSWWSLMVLRAKSFAALYERQKGLAPVQHPAYSEPCISQLSLQPPPALSDRPHGNHGDNLPNSLTWYQSDTMGAIWPSQSDSHPKSKPSLSPTAKGSVSLSIPSLALPLTPTSSVPKLPLPVPQLRYSLSLNPLPQALPPALRLPSLNPQSDPMKYGNGSTSSKTLSPSLALKPRKRTGPNSLSGIDATRQSRQIGGAL